MLGDGLSFTFVIVSLRNYKVKDSDHLFLQSHRHFGLFKETK